MWINIFRKEPSEEELIAEIEREKLKLKGGI